MLPNFTANVSVKSSLSLLLMKTWEQLEDPKYATVPQTHWDEARPSILKKYKCSPHSGETDDISLYGTTTCGSDSQATSKCDSKAAALHALNWNIEPLWRYCASQIHLDFNAGASFRATKSSENSSKKSTTFKESTTSHTPNTSSSLKSSRRKFKWLSFKSKKPKSTRNWATTEASKETIPTTETAKTHWQCPEAAFEVLPPLYENCDHSLLYQNSYLLDGVRYEYEPVKPVTPQQCVGAKLRLNYIKFLKSVNSTQKPTDKDVVFGNAKIITVPSPRWEGSRIDWLLNLERKQELRKLRCAEQQQQLNKTRECIKLSMTNNSRKTKVKAEHKAKADKSCKSFEKKRHRKKIDEKSLAGSADGNMCSCFPLGNVN